MFLISFQFVNPEQSGYVGFANLPNQVHRKSVKKGFEFTLMVVGKSEFLIGYIFSVNEKLPVSKFRYFGKYIIQLYGYCYVHASGQRQAGLAR